jgi:hypothetical protein
VQILHHLHFDTSCHCDHASEGQICAHPIDAVYTWVNGSDPKFIRDMMRYRLQLSTDMNGTDANNYTERYLH